MVVNTRNAIAVDTIRVVTIRSDILKRDNVRDHRAGTSDHPHQKHTQVRLRVHHIVIHRFLIANNHALTSGNLVLLD